MSLHVLFQQHKDYPTVRWVMCSICEENDPRGAKQEMTGSGTTTGLKRHIEMMHPDISIESGRAKKQKRDQQLTKNEKVGQI